MFEVYIISCGMHWEAVTINGQFVCSGDTYKECAEEVRAMGLIIK